MDPDVQLRSEGPLAQQPQIAAWLAAGKSLFIAREPAGSWTRGSIKDAGGRNNLNNTAVNGGFAMTRTRSTACSQLDTFGPA